MHKEKMGNKKEESFIKWLIKDIRDSIVFGAVVRILFFIPRLLISLFKNIF